MEPARPIHFHSSLQKLLPPPPAKIPAAAGYQYHRDAELLPGPPRCRVLELLFSEAPSGYGEVECWKSYSSILGLSIGKHYILYFIFRCSAGIVKLLCFPSFSRILSLFRGVLCVVHPQLPWSNLRVKSLENRTRGAGWRDSLRQSRVTKRMPKIYAPDS